MTTESDALPATSRIGRVALRVGDLDRQLAFHETVLGLTTRRREADTAVVGTDESPLFVLQERPDLPERSPRETGLFHAAVLVPSRAALGDALERVEREWELTGASDHLVSEALYLDDPEGNGIEIYRDRPRADWPTEDDGSVSMETLPLDLADLRAHGRDRDAAPPETTIGHVHLEVSDLAATRRFYADGLGMRVRQTMGTQAVFLAAGDYHHHVGANVWNGRTEPGDGRGLAWFEVDVPDAVALDSARDRFRAGGWDTDGLATGFAVRDPDGIELRVRSVES